jgi:peptide/nickel transport system permease protein
VRGARVLAVIGQTLAVAGLVVVVTFLLVRVIPGDPVRAITGSRGTPQAIAALRAQLHLNDALPTQFALFVSDIAHGNLGTSLIEQNRPVTSIISATLPVTVSIVIATVFMSLVIGIPLGLAAALSRRRSVDILIRGGLSVLLALPPFFLGLLLLLGPAGSWGWLPAGGWGGGWPENWRYVLLPCLALSAYLAPLIARAVRQAAVDSAEQQFVEASITRGLSSKRVAFRHVLPNSLLPLIALVALNIGALIAGAVVVESVFDLPGIGQELVNAVARRDYPVIQGIALVSALAVVLGNLAGDILTMVVDPRARRA